MTEVRWKLEKWEAEETVRGQFVKALRCHTKGHII